MSVEHNTRTYCDQRTRVHHGNSNVQHETYAYAVAHTCITTK